MTAPSSDKRLFFAISDKGGTGRSVTCANLAYRLAVGNTLARRPPLGVAYVDFDFGSPTSGAVFRTGHNRGVSKQHERCGVHELFRSGSDRRGFDDLELTDVWTSTADWRRTRPPEGAGRLTHVPGTENGAEFGAEAVRGGAKEICRDLLGTLLEDHDVVIVDLSAGRSTAVTLALDALQDSQLADRAYWLVHHRWTQQHIIAADGFRSGLLNDIARRDLPDRVRLVRTATVDLEDLSQDDRNDVRFVAWLSGMNSSLERRANEAGLQASKVLQQIPLEPLLQWREQIITDSDVQAHIARAETVAAFDRLATASLDPDLWEDL